MDLVGPMIHSDNLMDQILNIFDRNSKEEKKQFEYKFDLDLLFPDLDSSSIGVGKGNLFSGDLFGEISCLISRENKKNSLTQFRKMIVDIFIKENLSLDFPSFVCFFFIII